MTLGIDWVLSWIKEAARVIENNREALIKLDRDIGDGDHGENMDRGFAAVVRKIDDDTPTT
ncbi:MAG TPA: DAK2 domain-containing protein, partial [Beutenbergiaceae bacterium]|nr:DAK2 domain-containing protein [Beutenbergiaceae bacterium]